MEFSECRKSFPMKLGSPSLNYSLVDAAAAEIDPHRRIAFVAAFAMSNYSSTIGRIAKPFNPMLVRNRTASASTFVDRCTERDFRIRAARQEVPLCVRAS